jgi:hypothetical protein
MTGIETALNQYVTAISGGIVGLLVIGIVVLMFVVLAMRAISR